LEGKRGKGSSIELSDNKGLQGAIIMKNCISFPKGEDEFLRDSTGAMGFGVRLSSELIEPISEALKSIGSADKDILLPVSQDIKENDVQQVSEECQS
jgi:hypothetical protein